ncbi:MAG: histidine phosphatase family protein [Limnochordia bacterium]
MPTSHIPLRLYLLRHGESMDNQAHRFGGSRDSALTAQGLHQSQAASERLARVALDAVYTSPAKRSQVMADLLCAGRPLVATVCHALRETSFGCWEGKTYAEVYSRDPDACRLWMDNPLTAAPPGGESFLACVARVRAMPEEFTRMATGRGSALGRPFRIAVVAHGGVLRALAVCLLAAEPSLALRLTFDNASLSVVDLFGETAVIRCLNDTSHLSEVESCWQNPS